MSEVESNTKADRIAVYYVVYKCSDGNKSIEYETSTDRIWLGEGMIDCYPGSEYDFLKEFYKHFMAMRHKQEEAEELEMSERTFEVFDIDLGKRIRYVERLISSNLMRPDLRTYVADKVGLSADYISQLLKKQVGENFSEHVISIRMKTARQYVLEGKKSMSEIAHLVGMSQGGFSSAYKRIFGITPLADRKIFRGKFKKRRK
ncbi:MAG: helix-turn-helix transcriptional regulator [Lachnospiraceae bacterium]|nr:helix-turn-helix transcriptional regulator [Candidatus Equihabitans merdae]